MNYLTELILQQHFILSNNKKYKFSITKRHALQLTVFEFLLKLNHHFYSYKYNSKLVCIINESRYEWNEFISYFRYFFESLSSSEQKLWKILNKMDPKSRLKDIRSALRRTSREVFIISLSVLSPRILNQLFSISWFIWSRFKRTLKLIHQQAKTNKDKWVRYRQHEHKNLSSNTKTGHKTWNQFILFNHRKALEIWINKASHVQRIVCKENLL